MKLELDRNDLKLIFESICFYDMHKDMPSELNDSFHYLYGECVNYQKKVEKAQAKQPTMEWEDDYYDSLSEGKDQPQPVEQVSTTHRRKDMDLL